jgi:sugar diacid utilization regulator
VDAATRHIEALTKVGLAMASAADYEQALETLIRTISEILDVETAGFMLYDAEGDQLVLQEPAFGFSDPEVVRAYRVSLADGGNAVRVFLTREPYLSNDTVNDPRLLQRYVRMFHARNTASVPLVVEDEAIGVCHAINKRGGGFTGADLELFTRVAPLLAVSVRSAGMFRNLREQRRQLARAIDLQRELSRTAVEAPGMSSITERLADLVDHPVMVVDPAQQVLASHRWPAGLRPDGSWDEDRSPSPPAAPLTTPIAVGPHLGGHLLVQHGQTPLDEVEARAIEHAAGVFALELLRQQTSFEVEARLKGDLLQELVSGALPDDEAARALRDLGVTVEGPWRVVAVGPRWHHRRDSGHARWTDEVQPPESRLYSRLQEGCRSLLGTASVLPWRSRFLVLLPADSEDATTDAHLADQLRTVAMEAVHAIRPGSAVHVAVSSAFTSRRALGHAVGEAERALDIARSIDVADRPVLFEHLGVYRVLLSGSSPRDRTSFIDEALGPLRHHDAARGTALVDTLRSYVDSDYNAAEAARRLYVHVNTLAHRLRTIKRLLGGDPARGDLRLQVELALKLDDLGAITATSH